MIKKLLLLLFISSAALADFSAKVINVIDGDTIDVLTSHDQRIRIRLYGIDAPERGQAYVNKSRQFLTTLIGGKTVQITHKGGDIYHRSLGTVYYINDNINAKMVENGYAWAYRYRGNVAVPSMVALESAAKANRLGLWQDNNPTPPWDFRQNNR
ncbi:endonuclease YncB(thermonuclease family) [Orbus hercynius]|uniref:Endonuclease YncB(Thermonuclease family) n=1 Tax=Orbus hercynius TaxID=593135 RepID=A0A495RJD1_9GAMM|nr:thermonuclease family protein [Orbus hercynius]RKS87441.1 endonuclease YncB(thermonuclease family) [Orbus hercynius]